MSDWQEIFKGIWMKVTQIKAFFKIKKNRIAIIIYNEIINY